MSAFIITAAGTIYSTRLRLSTEEKVCLYLKRVHLNSLFFF